MTAVVHGAGLLLAHIVVLASWSGSHAVELRARSSVQSAQPGAQPDSLTPPQFLFVSSPMGQKVSYLELRDFRSTGVVRALVDSGLGAPHGIALDRKRSFLYVADYDARKIFRYSFVVQRSEATSELSVLTEGVRVVVVDGPEVKWICVDSSSGDLFYTEGSRINKITYQVLERLASGQFQPSQLTLVSESVLEAEASAAAAASLTNSTAATPEVVQPHILTMYEASVNSHVSSPAGIVTDGVSVYWANQENGMTAGSVIEGQVSPSTPLELTAGGTAASFESHAVASNAASSFGITKTHNMLIYSDSAQYIYGVRRTGGQEATLSEAFDSPRGLVWDGDNTIYIADQGANTIWSMPAGRLGPDQPLGRVVDVRDPFGLALLEESDPAFRVLAAAQGASARRAGGLGVTLVLLVAMGVAKNLSS